METKTISNVDREFGYNVITNVNTWIKLFYQEVKTKKERERIFKQIFASHLWKHIFDKFSGYNGNFASFFLNLDLDCQIRVLTYMDDYNFLNLRIPVIENWEQLADKYKLTGNNRTEKNVRRIGLMMRDVSEWDAWPHAVVWTYKFLMYANNNGIDGYDFGPTTKDTFDRYKGQRYGNWQNWAEFWGWCPEDDRKVIIDKLVNY